MAVASKNQMSVASTQAAVEHYIADGAHDVTALAEEVVFTVMATGQQFHGRQAVQEMLDYFYHGVFDAHPELTNMVVAPGQAVLEADFVGRHIGEFAGVPATGKEVHVPLCVVYDLEHDQIVRGRIYFETPAFLTQVGSAPDKI